VHAPTVVFEPTTFPKLDEENGRAKLSKKERLKKRGVELLWDMSQLFFKKWRTSPSV